MKKLAQYVSWITGCYLTTIQYLPNELTLFIWFNFVVVSFLGRTRVHFGIFFTYHQFVMLLARYFICYVFICLVIESCLLLIFVNEIYAVNLICLWLHSDQSRAEYAFWVDLDRPLVNFVYSSKQAGEENFIELKFLDSLFPITM